jgi:hypothetical protein
MYNKTQIATVSSLEAAAAVRDLYALKCDPTHCQLNSTADVYQDLLPGLNSMSQVRSCCRAVSASCYDSCSHPLW